MNPTPLTPDELRAILAQLHLTHAQAADLLGISPRTVKSWSLGQRPCSGPSAILLRLMSEARSAITDDVRASLRAHMETIL